MAIHVNFKQIVFGFERLVTHRAGVKLFLPLCRNCYGISSVLAHHVHRQVVLLVKLPRTLLALVGILPAMDLHVRLQLVGGKEHF